MNTASTNTSDSIDFSRNQIHKRLVVLYASNDMRYIWKKLSSDWKKQFKTKLPKRFKKHPEIWTKLNEWMDQRIREYVLQGGQDTTYYNKSDILQKGWNAKILTKLYPEPDKKVYLGRGRYAYYYNAQTIHELEDTEEFIEYINAKINRIRKKT